MRRSRRVAVALAWALVSVVVPGDRARPADVSAASVPAAPTSAGYWLVASDGGIFNFGGAAFHGSMGGTRLNQPMVGMASTHTGRGYWTVATDGGVFAFGDADFLGSMGGTRLNQPVVGMASTPSGAGYWLVASDGGIFNFGDAGFHGSTGALRLARPVVGMAATPSGRGYWLVASDGGVFAFGDARFHGSTGGARLASPIVALAPTPSGNGYWLVASDGGVFAFGDAPFLGSMGAVRLAAPVLGAAASPRGSGYWLTASDGGIFAFGDAHYGGSAGSIRLVSPVVGMAAAPVRVRPEVAVFYYPWYATPARDGEWRHWEGHGQFGAPRNIPSDYYPARGTYSSSDPVVLDQHMAELRGHGVDVVVSSWWGRGSFEDDVLPAVVAAARAHGLRVAAHVEPYSGRSPGSVVGDLDRFRSLGIGEVWLYDVMAGSPADWRPVSGASGFRFFAETSRLGDVLDGDFARWAGAAGFDGVYTYDPVRYDVTRWAAACGTARMQRLLCSPSVAPGHSAQRTFPTRTVVPRRDGARYDEQWADAFRVGADVVSVTSYNEWHEGTQLEAAVPHHFPDGWTTPGYDGAYGRTGAAAVNVYVQRTGMWTALFHGRW